MLDFGRRQFITLLSGAVAAWPLAARAQQSERVLRIGVLETSPDDSHATARQAAFRDRLRQLGWVDGRNAQIDVHWTGGSAAETRKYAAELAALAPDVILTTGASTGPMLQATNIIPIVFVIVPDPVGAGFVAGLSRPGGNATGFMQFEYNLSGKWLELLKEIAPSVTRAAILRDPATSAGIGQFAVIQSVASSVRIEVSPVSIREPTEIEQAIATFASSPNGGMVLTASALSSVHHNLIISLAARYKLPTVYVEKYYVADGGLISYGPDFIDQYRRAADYVDRILRGEKPADLPVQAPTKYELVINLNTARALGLTVPPSILARADDVIE
jgi:putative tryptophan/tyrosine transport system substrate-binding protein